MAAEPVSLPTTGELRAALEQAAEWIARYLDDVDRLPVLAQVKPGEIAAALPEHPPAHGEPLEAILGRRPRHRARPDPLEPPRIHGLLRHHGLAPRHPRRDDRRRP